MRASSAVLASALVFLCTFCNTTALPAGEVPAPSLFDADGWPIRPAETPATGGEAPPTAPEGRIVPFKTPGLNVTREWLFSRFGIKIGEAGLEAADLDGDGGLEIVAAAADVGQGFWYVLRHAAGEYPMIWAELAYPTEVDSLTTYDLDGDGNAEVLVGVGSDVVVYDGLDPVLIRTIPTAAADVRGLEVADVDGDLASELVFCDSSSLFVYDYATGVLEEEVVGQGGWDVAVGQVDADGGLEIVVANGSSGSAVLDGATRIQEWAPSSGFGYLVRTADLDGDGMEEIATGFWEVNVFNADLQALAWTAPVTNQVDALRLVDVEVDGPPELVFGDTEVGAVHVLNGATGAEKWQKPNPVSGVTNVLVADVDGDGTQELVWGGGQISADGDFLFVADTVTRADEWQSDHVDGPFYGLSWGDVDADGQNEILHTSFNSLEYTGDGFYFVHDAVTKAEEFRSGEVNPANLDGVRRIHQAQVDADPQEEIFVVTGSGTTSWIVAYDGLTHAQEWQVEGLAGSIIYSLEVVDVDGDADPELVAIASTVSVYDAATGFLEWQSPDLGVDHHYLRIANVDGDPNLEIVVARDQAELRIFDGVTQVEQLTTGDLNVTALATPDRNRDGVAEVIVGTIFGFVEQIDPATGSELEVLGNFPYRIDGLVFLDLTLDNVDDMVFCGADQLHIANGLDATLLYTSADLGTLVGRVDSLRVGDVDADGNPEALVNLGGQGVLLSEIEVASVNPPVVTIDDPADGSSFPDHTWVSFTATATDFEDGDISADVAWSSSLDGALGTGSPFSTIALSLGIHRITATITDSTGFQDSDEILVVINTTPPATVWTPGNVLVSDGISIYEYTRTGSLVKTRDILPHPDGEVGRDLVLDKNGTLHVYNGTYDPFLSSYTTAGVWENRTFDGWSTANNVSYGGIATLDEWVFTTDMLTTGAAPRGIVRFDTTGGPTVRFADTEDYIDLNVGLDCRLYALRQDYRTVDVFDPLTLAPLGSVTLAVTSVRGIAASADGEIFGVTWTGTIYHFDASGNVVNSIAGGASSLMDVNLATNGDLLVSDSTNTVILTTTALAGLSKFNTPYWKYFVAFVDDEQPPSCAPCYVEQSLTPEQWKMISLPCDVGASDSVQDLFGDDLDPVDYGNTWGLFERDEVGQVYRLLALSNRLKEGEGYWITTFDAGQTVTVAGDVPSPVDVPLVADPVAGVQNLVGHPFDFDVCWADVQVVDGASVLSLAEADPLIGPLRACEMVPPDASCVVSRLANKWNGAAYDVFDGVTANMQGTLVPCDGIWVEAFKAGVALRIPATPGSDCTFCTPQPVADAGPDQTICPGNSVTLGTPAQPGHGYSWSPGGETTAQITVSPASTTTYVVTATTACGTAQDNVLVTVTPASGGLFEDFEGDVSGWTATGLWHRTTSSTCFSPALGYWSPVRSYYYGQDASCDYDTGGRTLGTLTSPLIDVDATSELTFFYLRDAEGGGSYDKTDVQVVDGAVVTTVGSITSDATSWTQILPLSLATWAGKSIRIRFSFDSVDGFANMTPGWMIDDVAVSSSVSCSSRFPDPASGVPSKSQGDWLVRLGAQSADLNDPQNVLGQLVDALDGKDHHDLIEMAPFDVPYLSIVFPHPDWGAYAGDYASDFRAPHPTGAGEWRFDVIAAGLTAPVTLSWTSQGIALDRMALVDEATGERIAATPDGTYTFTMADGRSSFRWVNELCTGEVASGDGDFDGLCGDLDNCPADANPGQADGDGDGVGDACDLCWGDDSAGDADGDRACADVDCDDTDPAVREGCAAAAIFQDGFESGDVSSWSSAVGAGG